MFMYVLTEIRCASCAEGVDLELPRVQLEVEVHRRFCIGRQTLLSPLLCSPHTLLEVAFF